MPAEAISYTLTNVTQSYSTSPLNFSIRKELNEIGELSIELPFTSEINSKFTHGDTVELYRDSTLLFKGVIVEKELNKESKTIRLTILGEEVKLNWTLFSKNGSYRVQYDNVAANQIAIDILRGAQGEESVAWRDDWDAVSWYFRQEITITNNNNEDLTEFQVRLELDATKVGEHFDWVRMGEDLRFYDENGNKLSYYIESWDEVNKQAIVWVKVGLIPSNGTAKIKMYYGNSSAVSESDPEAVFEFFDDFEGSSLDTNKWAIAGTYEILEVANGALHLRTTDGFAGVITKQEFSNQYVVEDKSKLISRDKQTQVLYVDTSNRYVTTITKIDGWEEKIILVVDGTVVLTENETAQLSFDVYYIAKSTFNNGTIEYELYDEDYNILVSLSGSDSTYTNGKIGLGTFGKSTEPAEFYTDWVRVRKYAEQELTAEYGTEEYGKLTCPTTTLSMRFEYAQRWKALQKLADVLGKDLWLDGSGVHIGDKGSAKTLTYFKTIRKTENSEDIINKVHLLGTGDGINQYTATAEDTTSQNNYGLRERAYMLRDIENEDTLLLKAQQIITDNKDPVEYIEIEAPFTSDILSLDVGDTITINDSELGLSGDYRVKRLEIGPTTIRAELVNTIALLSDKLKEYYNGLESLGVYAQGATNLYSVQDSDNADPNHPLELKIYVPPEAIKINRVKLNLVVGPFRAYSKATLGGGATTQTSTASSANFVYGESSGIGTQSVTLTSVYGGELLVLLYNPSTTDTERIQPTLSIGSDIFDDISAMDVPPLGVSTMTFTRYYASASDLEYKCDIYPSDSNIEVYLYAIGDKGHSHEVSIPDHTHEIDFGIYEIDKNATVDIDVNGTVVKTGSTGETDLDITQYITTGWNTIKFTPSDLARIQASVFFQVFIQSR